MKKHIGLILSCIGLIMIMGFPAFAGDLVVKAVNVGFSETKTDDGAVWDAVPQVTSTSYSIINWSCAKDSSTWKAGEKVTFSVELAPRAGYTFRKDDTRVNIIGKNAKLKSKSVSASKISMHIEYWPSMKLPAIDKGSICYDENEAYLLRWDKVLLQDGTKWNNYEVRFQNEGFDDKSVEYVKVNTNKINTADYVYSNNYTISIRATTTSATKARYINNSDWVMVDDLNTVSADNTQGRFEGDGNKLIFIDPDGNRVTGWVSINGNWYYFDPENQCRAVNNNFKKINDKWYFFGENSVMKTGWVEFGGHKYYMDATYPETLGSMKTGWINTAPGEPQYFLNDGSIPNLPLGALFVNGVTPDGHTVDANGKRMN